MTEEQPEGKAKTMEETKPKHKFIKKGDNLVYKQIVRDTVLKPKDIVYSYDMHVKNINVVNNNLMKLRDNLVSMEKQYDKENKMLEDIKAYYPDALNYCIKNATKDINELKSSIYKKALEQHKPDVGFPDEVKHLELFNLWRHLLHTDQGLASNYPDSVLRTLLYKEKAIIHPDKMG